jgi:hypothetical protein
VVKRVTRAPVFVPQAGREGGVGVLRACRALEGASSVYVLEHALHGTRASLLEQLTSDAALLDASRDLLQLPAGECLPVSSYRVNLTQQSALQCNQSSVARYLQQTCKVLRVVQTLQKVVGLL